MDSYEQTKLVYRRGARSLAKYWESSGNRGRHIKLAFKLASIEQPSVLELGCGPGRDAAIIIRQASDYFGLDYSPELIAIAKKKLPQATFVVGDMVTKTYPPNRDVILAFASVLHLTAKQLEKVFDKAYASLRRGGIFYISTKSGEGVTTKRDQHGTRTYHLYNATDIQKLAGSGFEMVYENLERAINQDWTEVALKRV